MDIILYNYLVNLLIYQFFFFLTQTIGFSLYKMLSSAKSDGLLLTFQFECSYFFFFSENCLEFISVQFSCSVMSDSLQPHRLAHQASLSIINSKSLQKFMSIELVMPSNNVILCHPFLLLLSIFPSIRVSKNESVMHIR